MNPQISEVSKAHDPQSSNLQQAREENHSGFPGDDGPQEPHPDGLIE